MNLKLLISNFYFRYFRNISKYKSSNKKLFTMKQKALHNERRLNQGLITNIIIHVN